MSQTNLLIFACTSIKHITLWVTRFHYITLWVCTDRQWRL